MPRSSTRRDVPANRRVEEEGFLENHSDFTSVLDQAVPSWTAPSETDFPDAAESGGPRLEAGTISGHSVRSGKGPSAVLQGKIRNIENVTPPVEPKDSEPPE
jgi:hypothetical protein